MTLHNTATKSWYLFLKMSRVRILSTIIHVIGLKKTTEMRSKIFALIQRATILAVCTLQIWGIWQWNGNFMGFLGIFLKIVKNYRMKHE